MAKDKYANIDVFPQCEVPLSDIDQNELFKHFTDALESSDPRSYSVNQGLSPTVKAALDTLIGNHFDHGDFLEEIDVPATLLKSMSAHSNTLNSGDRIGDFLIIDKIAEGSFGQVYHAKQMSLERDVAIKVTPDTGEEGKTLAQLDHDHIVPIFLEQRVPESALRIICMPRLPGVTLANIISQLSTLPAEERSGAAILKIISSASTASQSIDDAAIDFRSRLKVAPLEEALLIIHIAICEAVQFAHTMGVLHLDIKPENILFDVFGRPKLADFNISKSQFDDESMVRGGTQHFMSPEQADAMARKRVTVGKPSDVYSISRVIEEASQLSMGSKISHPMLKTLRAGLATDPQSRPDIETLLKALQNCLKYLCLKKYLPQKIWGLSLIERHLRLSLVVIILLPNILGSLINIRYNAIYIVNQLTALQEEAFIKSIFVFNLLVYPAAIAILGYFINRCGQSFQQFLDGYSENPPSGSQCYGIFNKLNHLLILVPSIAWLAGSVIFPGAIDILAGPVKLEIYTHFFTSFVVSWLIAMTYSYLGVQFVLSQVVYLEIIDPLEASSNSSSTHRLVAKVSLQMLRLSVLVPLLGAIMVLILGKNPSDTATFDGMRHLTTALIVIGLTGFLSAFYAYQRILKSLT